MESLVGISSSLTTERMRDGLCPTCGTRLYQLKKESKMTKISNKLDQLSIKKPFMKKNRDGGEEGGVPTRRTVAGGGRDPRIDPQTKLMRIPLTIEGEVLRGQCLRCVSGEESRGGYESGIAPISVTVPAVTAATEAEDGHADMPDAVVVPVIATASLSLQINGDYRGQFNESGQRHGMGTQRWENGDKYEGTFWNGLMDGEGTLNFNDGTEYVGGWKLNQMDGQGTRRYPNGDVYTGGYRAGKRTGQGRCYFANGDLVSLMMIF